MMDFLQKEIRKGIILFLFFLNEIILFVCNCLILAMFERSLVVLLMRVDVVLQGRMGVQAKMQRIDTFEIRFILCSVGSCCGKGATSR